MKNFILNNCDTDSVSFCKPDMTPFTEDEQNLILKELNNLMPEKIKWENDGIFDFFIVVKAKNYVLYDGKKVKIKGSALRASMKEVALKEMNKRVIESFIFEKETIKDIYEGYIKEIYNIQDISRWTAKKTCTESVLNPKRTNELKVLEAIKHKNFQMGDKFRVFFTEDKNLKLEEDWNNDHDKATLVKKVYKNLETFKNIIDITQYPNYTLKKNKLLLEELLNK